MFIVNTNGEAVASPTVHLLTPKEQKEWSEMGEFVPQSLSFENFGKITRVENVTCTITEKIDGTNAAINFGPHGRYTIQSRKRLIYPNSIVKNGDNAGFATWVYDNADELFEFFGPGRHYGEWWGEGIQGNPYQVDRKFFTPFRWDKFSLQRYSEDPNWPDQICPLPVIATDVPLVELESRIATIAEMLNVEGSWLATAEAPPYTEGVMIWSRDLGYLKHPWKAGPKNHVR